MRVKNIIAGLLGLTAITAAAPALSSYENTCIPSISTIFATPSAVYITVTVHDAPESTVYVTVPSISYVRVSQLPTTLTHVSTSTSITTAPQVETVTLGGYMAAKSSPIYDSTVTETAVVTVIVHASQNIATSGPLSFVVVDGTTSWLDGKTPSADQSYVYASSVVTVVPVISDPEELTTTLKSTVQLTSELTVTKTLPTSTASILVGTGFSFTAIPSGGWNVSTLAAGVTSYGSGLLTTGTAPASSKPTLVTNEPTFDLYPTTTRSSIYISSYAAQSGFKGYTTLTPPAITSSAGGWTTAVANGQTWSWTSTAPSPSTSSSPAAPPYANSTLSTTRRSTQPPLGSTFSTAVSSGTANSRSVPSIISTVPSITSVNQTSTSASYATSTSPTKCGAQGDFILDFDDIPPLAIGNQSIDDVAPLPVFNPYHQFDFSDGFVVVPPPRVPYLPSSKPLLLEFIPNFTVNRTDDESGPNAREFGWSGDIGNGDHGLTGCFSFNMYGASFGCDSQGADCIFTFSGFRYNRVTKLTSKVTTQSITVGACPKLNDCTLTPVTLDNTFQNLDAVRMNVTVGGLPKLWWADDVRLGWFDNSCAKGLCRQTTKIH